jgi:hypothetical protein
MGRQFQTPFAKMISIHDRDGLISHFKIFLNTVRDLLISDSLTMRNAQRVRARDKIINLDGELRGVD